MTLKQIKTAVKQNKLVYWKNENYRVIRDSIGQWLIHSQSNDCYWGLTWRDGKTLNGESKDFFTSDK